MATIAGSVKSLSTGVFNVKDENGNVRALKVGDEIYENDTVYGENGNTSSSQVEIQLSGNDVIVLNAGQKQLIDSSLIETAFGTEELFFTREALDLKADNYNSNADVVSDLRDAEFTSEKKESEQDGAFADANNADATKEETAEGEEEVEDETAGTGEFQARTGAATDINSDLRNAQFKARTQVFEDKSAFENESKDRLTSLTNTDRPSYTTPSVIQITPSTPPVQQVVTPPPAAPIIVIGNLSVNDITQYESEGFLIFTVTLDRPVASPVTFDYKTSPITASPNGKDYTDVFGKITIPAGSTSVTIKVPITDDYVSDNGETIKITITNVVGNATITKPEGIGTILDNPVNNPGNGTPNTPKEPGGYGEEDTVYAIIVGPGTVNEGNITTDYTVKLIDKDGNPVVVTKDTNVTVKYLNIDTEDNDTQYKNNDKITVTIKAGTSSNTFKVETKDDYISDNNEKYNLSIEKVNTNEFENVVIGDKTGNFKDVTTTILDNSKPDGNTPHDPNEPPKNVEKDAEIVQIKLVALYENGTPVLDSNGNYTFANSVNEGNTAKYMALAFAPGETVFSPSTKLVDQLGTIDVTFGNDTAIGIGSQTKTDGLQDFNNTAQAKVALGTVITTATYDDWKADNGETFTISITTKSYAADARGSYENVEIDTRNVTTTILDDSRGTPAVPATPGNPEVPAVPHNPNTPPVGKDTPPTPKHPETNHEIVQIKLVACDKDGNPIMDGDSYTFENKTPEGNQAFYMAIAFKPGATTYTKETKLADADQLGSVTVSTKDLTTTTDAKAGDDYTSISTQKVNLNTAFSVDTLDDYIADNGEKYEVVIDAISYDPNKIGEINQKGYENVSISGKVTTTILDDSNPKPDGELPDSNIPTDTPTEKTQEQVILKIVACDASGKPIMAGADDKTYTFVNTVAEGNEANYMVLAFKPGTTTFTTDNLASVQGGTVTIQTADSTIGKIATGIATQTLTDGTQDYQTTETTVIVGTAFNVKTFDDFMSDNDETYTVLIKDATYAHPATPLYENVTTDSSVVTTTIKDDTGTPNTSDDGVETTHESVIIKLVALDNDNKPILDKDGNYTFENNVVEGNGAKYMALAFAPNETTFSPDTKLTVQAGKVEVTSRDTNPVDAKGTTETTVNKNDNDGSKDYVISTQTVELGTVITVATLDDYVADNGEKYEVALNADSYTAPAIPVYENVSIDGKVTTTILDDTDTTPNNPLDTPKENDAEQVILKIVACDASGNPIMTGAGGKEYTFENGVNEGIGAKYMVLAFKPGTTVFTTDNVLANDKQGGTVTIKTANDSATGVTTQTKNDGTQDYILETTKEVTVGTSFTVTTLNDFIVDDGEKYTVAINDGTYKHPTTPIYENVKTDSGIVTTTITDDPQEATIVLVAVDSATTTIADITDTDGKLIIAKTNSTPESGKLYYMAVAIDKDTGKPLDTQSGKVTAKTYDNSATGGTTPTPPIDGSEDYGHINKQVDIGKVFEVQTNDDYLAEGNENYTVIITAPVAPVYENAVIDSTNNTVTSTITDNPAKVKQPTDESNTDTPTDGSYDSTDTVYVKIIKPDSVVEGGNLVHTVTLVDKNGVAVKVPNGKTVTVTLEYTSTGDVVTDGDFSTIVKEVIITGGNSSQDFTNITKDDFTSEGTEVYTVTITSVTQSGAFENVAIADSTAPDAVKNLDSTTGTIKDGVTLGTPVNAIVLEDGLNTTATSNITVSVGGVDYTTPVGTSENDLAKSLGITNPNADTYTVSFDKNIAGTDKTSNGKAITYSYNEAGTLLTATRADDSKVVFTVELKKDGTNNDVYDFKLKEPMDHVYGNNGKNTFDMPFKFNVTSNGTKSDNVEFKVTVVDSVPSADPITATTKEDKAVTVRLADDDFKAGEKVTINGVQHDIETSGIAIYEQGDATKQIGSLTINSNGTVTFTPVEDYSNYNTAKSPQFSYTVKDFDGDEATSTVTINVKPVADAPRIVVSSPTMIEDNANINEGAAQVGLELKVPTLSKDSDKDYTLAADGVDQTGSRDQNSGPGDHPERNGEITLTFTNGDKVTGAKIFKADGTTQVGANITAADQELKIVIVTVSGDSNTIDYTYHHKNITNTVPAGAIYLTQAEYQALKIQHAEDNDTNINIKIGVTSYELDDNDKPLDTTDVDLYETKTADMIVKINPATDKFSLNWDGTTNAQVHSVDVGTKTVVFKNITENNSNPKTGETGSVTSLDLKALLTPTSGTSIVGGTDSKLDLDGSEKRSYTIKLTETGGKDLPDYIYITIGSKTDVKAYKNANDEYTVAFGNDANTTEDPAFSMKFADYWSGTVTGTITLTSIDKGVDSTDAAGTPESDFVKFEVTVLPIANIATIQVSQAVGFEDAGRSGGNTDAKSDAINANGTGGIPLDIKVTSDDKDGSEKFDVTISGIPAGAVIYYDGAEKAGASITITDFDNTKSLVIIPPHNSDAEFTLGVSAVTKDGASVSAPTVTTIDVIVKNVADAPVGTELNTNTIEATEDMPFNLKDIYKTGQVPLASYDDSEVLTVKIDFKDTGITIVTGTPFYIENGMYVVKASDIVDGKILLNVPKDFSGSTSFDLTYVTTEKAGEGDSKTWNIQPVTIFVNPVADNVTIAKGSTIYEDADADGNGIQDAAGINKIDLKPTFTDTDGNGVETITSVKILGSSVPAGYKLYSDAAMTTELTKTGSDYVITSITDSIYAKNATTHTVSGDFTLKVEYTVKDTNGSVSNEKIFSHDHIITVKAVTDAPTLTLGTITQESGSVTISGSNVTIVNENSEFKVPVTTTSSDKDGSEAVTKIVISGVPMGVEVIGGTYYGYSGSMHNGIWEILAPADSTLDANGALSNIVFKVNTGADFEQRDITITTYTQDGSGAEVKSDSQTIHINAFDAPSTGPGNPPLFDLSTKTAVIYEDNNDGTQAVIYNLGKSIDVTNSGGSSSGNYAITFTDFPKGTTVTGASYSYVEGTKTYYVVTGTGSASDVEAKLSTVIVTPPTDKNSNQDGSLKSNMTFTATIMTNQGGTYKAGKGIVNADSTKPGYTNPITPVTDKMTVAVTADNINEDGTSNLSITLSNPSDGNKAVLVGNSLTITITETWKDVATGGGTKGILSGTGYNIVEGPAGTYTITKTDGTAFPIDTAITGLQYTPASNRDGDVKFEVSVKNQEGTSITLDSTGDKTITVTPVVDVVLNASVVTAIGKEDVAVTVGTTILANPVKLEITAGTFADGSEKIGNIILDEVPNGFTVWYKVGTELVMATNIGTTGGGTFDINPNIIGDAEVTRNKWLVPASADGSMPEVYINAPTNWSGDFGFKAKFSITEQNLSTATSMEVPVTGHINSVADTMTIAPTLTFGEAFSWVDLKLNANMKDIDGSETMSLKITGLDDMAQFQLANGTAVNSLYNTATNTWELKGITYDQINNIQFAHDKSVASVGVTANTVEKDNIVEGDSTSSVTFELKVSDVSGNFKLDAGLSLDFNKIDTINTLKNIDTIDLTQTGSNKLLNLSLQDVLDMSGSNKEIKITGTGDDEVSFKTGDGWNAKTAGTGSDAGFDIYTNSGDSSVKVKVEQDIPII